MKVNKKKKVEWFMKQIVHTQRQIQTRIETVSTQSCCNLTAPSVSSSCSVCDWVWLGLQRSRRQWGTGVGLDRSGPGEWKQTGSFTFFPYSQTWNISDSSHNWWLSIFHPVKLLVSVMSLLERRGKRKPATLPPSGDSLSRSLGTNSC